MSRLHTLNQSAAPPKAPPNRFISRIPLMVLLSIGCVGLFLHLTGFFDKLSLYAQNRLDRKMVAYGMNLSNVFVKGRERTPLPDILNNLGLRSGESFRKLDLPRAFESLRRLPWIKEVIIERRWPNHVLVTVSEKKPLALWQHHQKIQLVDSDGHPIHAVDIASFTRYPLIIGEGAPKAAPLFLNQLSRVPSLRPHIHTMVRVGQRRWNITLSNGLTILLPEDRVEEALMRLNTLHTTHNITEIAKKNIDLRIPQKVIYE